MASKARPGQSDITVGLAVSSPAAAHINRLINSRARAAGVTPAEFLAGLLSGKFPPLKPEEIAAINLRSSHGQIRQQSKRQEDSGAGPGVRSRVRL